jgi:hypothetical protein
MRLIATTIAALAILGILLSCSDRVDLFYKTYNDVRRDNAIERGLIPSVMPSSATNILQSHCVDAGIVYIRFHYDANSKKELEQNAEKINSNDIASLYTNIGCSPKWWPDDLMAIGAHGIPTVLNYDVYRHSYTTKYGDGHEKVGIGFFFLGKDGEVAYYCNGG